METKFKEAGNDWYIKIFPDGTKTPSWNKKNKPGYYQEMMDWVAEGNEIEPQFTAEELVEKEAEEARQALENQESELLNLIKSNEYHLYNDEYIADRPIWVKQIAEWHAQRKEVQSGKLVEISKSPFK